jgi:uncharacterized repeat protein (TIGR01451 family)
LDVTVTGPTTADVGADVQFLIEVTNRGTTPAARLLVTDRFDEGLEHVEAKGVIEHDLVDLQPGGTTRLAVSFHVSRAGQLCQEISISSGGEARATTRYCISAAAPPAQGEPQPLKPEGDAQPIVPAPGAAPTPAAQLTVTKQGPKRAKVGETVRFTIEVTNRGATAIENLEVADNFETTLEPASATRDWQWLAGGALGWKVASFEPGRTLRYEIELKCLRETPRACNRVTVSAPGMEPVADEACMEIAGEGGQAPAAAPGAVTLSVADTADPIKLGGQTTYQIVLENKGETSVFEVEVSVKYTDELRLQEIGGLLRGSITAGAVRFPAIRELRAGEPLDFQLRFVGARAGTGRVQVEVKSRGQPKPVTSEQTTEVLR